MGLPWNPFIFGIKSTRAQIIRDQCRNSSMLRADPAECVVQIVELKVKKQTIALKGSANSYPQGVAVLKFSQQHLLAVFLDVECCKSTVVAGRAS
jgi:hypothetical protein